MKADLSEHLVDGMKSQNRGQQFDALVHAAQSVSTRVLLIPRGTRKQYRERSKRIALALGIGLRHDLAAREI